MIRDHPFLHLFYSSPANEPLKVLPFFGSGVLTHKFFPLRGKKGACNFRGATEVLEKNESNYIGTLYIEAFLTTSAI